MASTGGSVRSSSSESGRRSWAKGLVCKSPEEAVLADGCKMADHTEMVSELIGTGNTALREMPLKQLLCKLNENEEVGMGADVVVDEV